MPHTLVNTWNCFLFSVRLVGGSTVYSGRVEIFHGGEWGTVCDDRWDDDDARVVCRQLGYTGGIAETDHLYGQGSGRIWLDNVECTGREVFLIDCTANPMGAHNCGHYEDAGVSCRPDHQ